MYEEIDMSIIADEWRKSKQFNENYTGDFKDLDTLVDGIPLNREKGSPYVGDTTLPALVRQIPRDSLQQLPVFAAVVNGTKNSVAAHVCSYLLRSTVFNEDTFGKGFLSTMQIGGEQALTHGYAPFMTATEQIFGEFGTKMRLMHYTNVSPEPGIQDDSESGFWYVDADIVKSRMRKILRGAKANPDTTWDVAALEELLQLEPAGADYSQYLSAARQPAGNATGTNTYKLTTRYEVGAGGKFVTFCPQMPDRALRVIDNKSKFGFPRVQLLVIDPAPLTPFGISRVKLASPNQNLMNAYYMNIASMLILNSKPPVLKRGRFTTPIKLTQGAVWEAMDQNATASLVELNNGALEHFVPFAQQFASQIQNIMGSPRGNISGGTNGMGFSKTAPGVKQQSQEMDRSTNQITNIMENFVRQYALVALDTILAEQEGDDELILDDEAKNAINRIAEGTVGDDNIIKINWETFYDAIKKLRVEIELSMGKEEMDEKVRGDLQDTLTTLLQNSDRLPPEMVTKATQILDMLLEKTVPQLARTAAAAPVQPLQPQMIPEQVVMPGAPQL